MTTKRTTLLLTILLSIIITISTATNSIHESNDNSHQEEHQEGHSWVAAAATTEVHNNNNRNRMKSSTFIPASTSTAPLRASSSSHNHTSKQYYSTSSSSVSGTAAAIAAKGMVLSAHIITSTEDGLSYFVSPPLPSLNDNNNPEEYNKYYECLPTIIPYDRDHYNDCSSNIQNGQNANKALLHNTIIASTTELLLGMETHIRFRHFPAVVETSWGMLRDEEALPQLVICLHPLEVIVSGNGEETRVFQAGDVLLFEDYLGKGHKLRSPKALENSSFDFDDQTISVLTVAIPSHYGGVDAVLGLNSSPDNTDCSSYEYDTMHSKDASYDAKDDSDIVDRGNLTEDDDLPESSTNRLHSNSNDIHAYKGIEYGAKTLFGVPVRQIAMAAVGTVLSSVVTIKLSEVIPAKYSVALGQACVIGAGATASTLLCNAVEEAWLEQKNREAK